LQTVYKRVIKMNIRRSVSLLLNYCIWLCVVSFGVIFLVGSTNALARTKTKFKMFCVGNNCTSKFTSPGAACGKFNSTEGASWIAALNFNITTVNNSCPYGPIIYTQQSSFSPQGGAESGSSITGPVCKYLYNASQSQTAPALCGEPSFNHVEPQSVFEYGYITKIGACSKGWIDNGNECISPDVPPPDTCPSASVPTKRGNPVDITGCKTESYPIGQPSIGRRSNSVLNYSGDTFQAGGFLIGDPNWFIEPIDRHVRQTPSNPNKLIAVRSARHSVEFNKNSSGVWVGSHPGYSIAVNATGYIVHDSARGIIDRFNLGGTLAQSQTLDGYSFAVSTSSANPNIVLLTDNHGRVTQYLSSNGKLQSITLPGGQTYTFNFGSGLFSEKLSAFNAPDGTNKQFLYQQSPLLAALLASGGSPEGLMDVTSPPDDSGTGSGGSIAPTEADYFGGFSVKPLIGVKDETGIQLSSFGVTDTGRTISTQRFGGVGKFEFLLGNGQTAVTNPNGSVYSITLSPVNSNRSVISYAGLLSADGTQGYSQSMGYDTTGSMTSSARSGLGPGLQVTNVQCYQNDTVRELELKRLEGRSSNDCTSLVPVSGTAERLISSQWHPDWVLKSREAQPRLITTWVYQGRPDPTASNAVANCLPAGTPMLVNGKPYAVLCKKIEQGTNDATGALGFTAPAAGTARVWTYAYGSDGQMLTENGPRTDITDVTTYTYYTATDTAVPPKFYKGDLKTVTNSSGHVTTYNEYEPNGKLQKMTDANGVVTTMTYHVRGWLTGVSITSGSITQTTSYEYWPTGLLKKVTQPDASFVSYSYDSAQRLTGIADNLGNTVMYTLDNSGNRIKEEFKDSGGALRRNIARVMDSLSRVQSITGAAQ
jgi:YD repeat-containing protein